MQARGSGAVPVESGQLEYVPTALCAGPNVVRQEKPDKPEKADASMQSAGTSFNVQYEQVSLLMGWIAAESAAQVKTKFCAR